MNYFTKHDMISKRSITFVSIDTVALRDIRSAFCRYTEKALELLFSKTTLLVKVVILTHFTYPWKSL